MLVFLKTVTSLISRTTQTSLLFTISLEIISSLQIIYIILKTALSNIKDSTYPVFAGIRNVIAYVSDVEAYGFLDGKESTIKLIWIISACYLFIFLILMATTICYQALQRSNKSTLMTRITSMTYLIHSRVIFFIIQNFLVHLASRFIDCNVDGINLFYCKSQWFYPTIVLLCLNVGQTIVKEWLLYQVNKRNKNKAAIKNNIYHKAAFLHKTISIFLYYLIDSQNSRIAVTSSANILLSVVSLTILYMKLPFYNISLLKLCIVLSGIAVGFSLFSIPILVGLNQTMLDLAWIVLTTLLVKGLLLGLAGLSDRILHGVYRTPEEAIHYVSLLKKSEFGYVSPSIYLNKYSLGVLVSNGVLLHQKANLSGLHESKNLNDKREYESVIYLHVLERLSLILEKNSNSMLLLLNMAYICSKKLKNIPRAMMYIKRLESQSLSVPMSNSLDDLNCGLKEIYTIENLADEERNQSQIKLLEYFSCRDAANLLKEDIESETQKHVEFWEEIKKESADIKKTLDISCNIDFLSEKIQKKWQELNRTLTHNFINSLLMYGGYLDLIKEFPGSAKKLITRFWNSSHNANREQILDVYSAETAILVISMEKSNTGIITDTSGSAQTFFHTEKANLLGQNLANLLPKMVSKNVMSLLESYMKAPSKKLDHNLKSFIKTHNNEFFEVEIQLKLFPKLDKEVKLMAVFKKTSISRPIMIVNTDGTIVDCSGSLYDTFHLRSFVKSKTMNLKFQEISPDFNQINNAFNTLYGNEKRRYNEDFITPIKVKNMTKVMRFDSKFSLNHHEPSSGRDRPNSAISSKTKKITQQTNTRDKLSEQLSQLSATMSPNRSKEVCNEYLRGSRLQIFPLDEKSTTRQETMFEVQVIPYQVGAEVYKVLVINSYNGKRTMSKIITKDLDLSKIDSPSSGFAADFPAEEERKENLELAKQHTDISQHIEGMKSRTISQLDDENTPTPVKIYRGVYKNEGFGTRAKDTDTGELVDNEEMKVKSNKNKNSISSQSSGRIGTIKSLQNILNRGQSYPLARTTGVIVVSIMVSLAILVVSNLLVSKAAIGDITTGIRTVNVASLRLSQAIGGWQSDIRFLLRSANLRSGDIGTLLKQPLAPAHWVF